MDDAQGARRLQDLFGTVHRFYPEDLLRFSTSMAGGERKSPAAAWTRCMHELNVAHPSLRQKKWFRSSSRYVVCVLFCFPLSCFYVTLNASCLTFSFLTFSYSI